MIYCGTASAFLQASHDLVESIEKRSLRHPRRIHHGIRRAFEWINVAMSPRVSVEDLESCGSCVLDGISAEALEVFCDGGEETLKNWY